MEFKPSYLALAVQVGVLNFAYIPVIHANETSDNEVEEVVVTGSRIKRTDIETANPVSVISSEDLKAKGFTSLQSALESLPEMGPSLYPDSNGFTPGATGVDLRNAGIQRTLVLVDGKRIAKYAGAYDGKYNFYDINSIPMLAVERIEVMRGSTSVYGSDGIGGVINIILKNDFEGSKIATEFSDTEHGGLAKQKLSLVSGFNDGGFSLLGAIDISQREALKSTDRSNWDLDSTDSALGTGKGRFSSIGATIRGGGRTLSSTEDECKALGLAYDDGECLGDYAKWTYLAPEENKLNALAKLDWEVTDNQNVFINAGYTKLESKYEMAPVPAYDVNLYKSGQNDLTLGYANDVLVNGKVQSIEYNRVVEGAYGAAANGWIKGSDDILIANGKKPSNYTLYRRLTEVGPRQTDTTLDKYNVTLGSTGDLLDGHSYEAYIVYDHQELKKVGGNAVLKDRYLDVLADRLEADPNSNLLGPLSASEIDFIRYETDSTTVSQLTGASFVVSGLFMPEFFGNIYYSTGVEFFHEKFNDEVDSQLANKNIVGSGGTSADGDRDQVSAFAELSVPVSEKALLSLASRYDKYSEVDGNFSSQAGLEYRKTENLLLRGSIVQSFRVPDLSQVYKGNSASYSDVTDYNYCAKAGLSDTDCETYQIGIISQGNEDLEPEKALSYSAGALYSDEDFEFSFDYYYLEIKNLIEDLEPQYILDHSGTYGNNIQVDEDGKTELLTIMPDNIANQILSGFNVGLKINEDVAIGSFDYGFNLNYQIKNQRQSTKDAAYEDYLVTENYPKLKGNAFLNFYRDAWRTTLNMNYVGEMAGERTYDKQYDGRDSQYRHSVPEWITYNWSLGYTTPVGLGVQFGINNIFDESPELDSSRGDWPYYPRSYHNAIGRQYVLNLDYSF